MAEPIAHNNLVPGSSPGRPTKILFLILFVCAALFWLVDKIGLSGDLPVIFKTFVTILGIIAVLIKIAPVLDFS